MLNTRQIVLCIIATIVLTLPAQAEPPVLNPGQISNLHLIGKVWGYLKYHHPTITSGCLNWDEQLIREIPSMLDATDREQIVSVLETWVDDLEKPIDCAESSPSEQHLGPRTEWLTDKELLGTKLVDHFRNFEVTESAGGQYYVAQRSGVGNPIFRNESSYSDVDDFDWRYRLLALYRFWNIVEYWFPYRDLIDEDWDEVLADSITRFYSAKSQHDYLLELARLVARINDGHANVHESIYVRPPGGRKLPPFAIRMVEGMPFIWRKYDIADPDAALPDIAAKDQLLFGDIIVKVNGEPIEELFATARPYIGASNTVSENRVIAQFLLHGESDSVSLQIERDGRVIDVTTRRLQGLIGYKCAALARS